MKIHIYVDKLNSATTLVTTMEKLLLATGLKVFVRASAKQIWIVIDQVQVLHVSMFQCCSYLRVYLASYSSSDFSHHPERTDNYCCCSSCYLCIEFCERVETSCSSSLIYFTLEISYRNSFDKLNIYTYQNNKQ